MSQYKTVYKTPAKKFKDATQSKNIIINNYCHQFRNENEQKCKQKQTI